MKRKIVATLTWVIIDFTCLIFGIGWLYYDSFRCAYHDVGWVCLLAILGPLFVLIRNSILLSSFTFSTFGIVGLFMAFGLMFHSHKMVLKKSTSSYYGFFIIYLIVSWGIYFLITSLFERYASDYINQYNMYLEVIRNCH